VSVFRGEAQFYYSDHEVKDQIKEDIEEKGGKLISRKLTWIILPRLLPRGSWGYEVRFIDVEGREHIALCKPSHLGKAYWSNDIIVDKVKLKYPNK
jgi:hypothetical protein